jgi:hypothetical protein
VVIDEERGEARPSLVVRNYLIFRYTVLCLFQQTIYMRPWFSLLNYPAIQVSHRRREWVYMWSSSLLLERADVNINVNWRDRYYDQSLLYILVL